MVKLMGMENGIEEEKLGRKSREGEREGEGEAERRREGDGERRRGRWGGREIGRERQRVGEGKRARGRERGWAAFCRRTQLHSSPQWKECDTAQRILGRNACGGSLITYSLSPCRLTQENIHW